MIDIDELQQNTDTLGLVIKGIESHFEYEKLNPDYVLNALMSCYSKFEEMIQNENSTRSTDQSITSANL